MYKFTGIKGNTEAVEFYIDKEWKDIKVGELFTQQGKQYVKVSNKSSFAHRYKKGEEVLWNNEPSDARFALRYDTRDAEYWDRIFLPQV